MKILDVITILNQMLENYGDIELYADNGTDEPASVELIAVVYRNQRSVRKAKGEGVTDRRVALLWANRSRDEYKPIP